MLSHSATPTNIASPKAVERRTTRVRKEVTQRTVVTSYRRFGPETSVRNCRCTLRNDRVERSSGLLRGGSLTSHEMARLPQQQLPFYLILIVRCCLSNDQGIVVGPPYAMIVLLCNRPWSALFCPQFAVSKKNTNIEIIGTITLPVDLYGCETWSFTLRQEHRLRVLDNRVLVRMFWPKG